MKFDAVYIVRCSLFFVSVVIVAINGYELLAGGGYASGARFFGVAGHPNFLGVQMAFCCLVGAAHQGQKLLISKLARYAVIAISIYILYKSGSRTGIIVLFVGYAAYYTINNPAKNTLIFASILSFATLMIVASGFMDSLFTEGVYARNDVNTRAGVWQDLWDIVKQAPLIGHGYLPDSTANSWLRGWATVGVIYPIFLLLIISSFLKQIVKAWGTPYLKHASMLIGIFFAITTGSILEGYLFDANSLPIHAWFISLITSSIYLSLMNGRSSFVGQIKRPAEKFDRRMAASSQEIALKAQQ
ncbi:MAG: O-antigen ligase domain-containing protein [Sphingobacteriales bacterium]|nr:MAG: O-antigen ligase domain-containing protein [Sphingobacteriales bacterium]